MATFSKRVQPKHRATPGDRTRTTAPAPRPGSHAAPVVRRNVAPKRSPRHRTPPHRPTPRPRRRPSPHPSSRRSCRPSCPRHRSRSVSRSRLPPNAGPLRVLVVDDNEDVRGLLRIAFARADIDVVGAAGDSTEALRDGSARPSGHHPARRQPAPGGRPGPASTAAGAVPAGQSGHVLGPVQQPCDRDGDAARRRGLRRERRVDEERRRTPARGGPGTRGQGRGAVPAEGYP